MEDNNILSNNYNDIYISLEELKQLKDKYVYYLDSSNYLDEESLDQLKLNYKETILYKIQDEELNIIDQLLNIDNIYDVINILNHIINEYHESYEYTAYEFETGYLKTFDKVLIDQIYISKNVVWLTALLTMNYPIKFIDKYIRLLFESNNIESIKVFLDYLEYINDVDIELYTILNIKKYVDKMNNIELDTILDKSLFGINSRRLITYKDSERNIKNGRK